MGLQTQIKIMLQRLLELYCQKHTLLMEMLRATSERSRMNEAERSEEILKLIETRQVCIEKIDALDTEIQQFTMRFTQLVGGEAGLSRLPDNLAGTWGKIKEQRHSSLQLVAQMQEMDREQKPKLVQQLLELKKQRENLKTSRQTISAYNNKRSTFEGVFIDKKE